MESGVCSFCGESPVAAWFEGPTFTTLVRTSTAVRAEEAWLTCARCLVLVEAQDRDALALRGVARLGAGRMLTSNVPTKTHVSGVGASPATSVLAPWCAVALDPLGSRPPE